MDNASSSQSSVDFDSLLGKFFFLEKKTYSESMIIIISETMFIFMKTILHTWVFSSVFKKNNRGARVKKKKSLCRKLLNERTLNTTLRAQ